MNKVLNRLIEFGKEVLSDSEYLNDASWISGAEQFYNEKYKTLSDNAKTEAETDRIIQIMLAQFEYIDADSFRTFFSHYGIRSQLESFESRLFAMVSSEQAVANVNETEYEFDAIIDNFNADYIEQEQEWLSNKITDINGLLSELKKRSENNKNIK